MYPNPLDKVSSRFQEIEELVFPEGKLNGVSSPSSMLGDSGDEVETGVLGEETVEGVLFLGSPGLFLGVAESDELIGSALEIELVLE